MTIRSMTIENVRGISQLTVNSHILKNRPNILVAPNGFGKTSIATAFKDRVRQGGVKSHEQA